MNNTTTLLAAVLVLTTACGPGLNGVSTAHNATLSVEISNGTAMLTVSPTDGSTPESCPALDGAVATIDGVEMKLLNSGGWHLTVPGPFPTTSCSGFLWTAPFDAAHDPSTPVTFTLRQGLETWELVARNVGAPHPLTVTDDRAMHGGRVTFPRAATTDAGVAISAAADFTPAGSTGVDPTWSSVASNGPDALTLNIPFESKQGAGTLSLTTWVQAEVQRCTGAPSCHATYATVQQVPFTVF